MNTPSTLALIAPTPPAQAQSDPYAGIAEPQAAQPTQPTQPAQQDPYASIAEPSQSDPYAGIAETPATTTTSAPTKSVFQRAKEFSEFMEGANPLWAQTVGTGKETVDALAGIMNIVNDHASGVIPTSARTHMQNAAQWLKQQGELRGWTEPGGASEHIGAMGADYLGYEGLAALASAGAAAAGTGAAVAGGTKLVQAIKQAANMGEILDKFPVLKQAAGIGLRTVSEAVPALKTAGVGGTQSYIMSGGNRQEALGTAILSGILHLGGQVSLGPLGEYLQSLRSEAAEAARPLPPPVYTPGEAAPELPAAEPKPRIEPEPKPTITPEPRPTLRIPTPRAPAAQRFGSVEQQAAQRVAQEHLEDLNRYRTVNAQGTPTNIQQLGLPSQSVTQPYEFRVPGWSSTSETGDLLHEAGARYRHVATRVVAGKGQANMQPWEMQQIPFDLARYAETPGAVVVPEEGAPVAVAEETPTAAAAEPGTAQRGSHREPIMQATEYRTSVRPGSVIRQENTIGGPSVLTSDPQIAAAHLDQIDRIVQSPNFTALAPETQSEILQSRNDVMRQMQEYQQLRRQHEYSPYLHHPTFEPVDVNTAISRIGDMGDAADEMMRGPKEMYNRWEDLTKDRPGGSFKDLNEEINDLRGQSGASSRRRLAEAETEMQRMFSGTDPYLGRAGTNVDLAIARAQFYDGYLVKRIDDGITNAFTGAARTGEFNVRSLQSNWKSLVNDVGVPRMQNVLGIDRFEGMNNIINDLAAEPAAEKQSAASAAAELRTATEEWKARQRELQAQATQDWQQRQLQRQTTATEEWQQREAERIAAEERVTAAWQERERVRRSLNLARKAEYAQQQAARTGKRTWYFDLARNGWHHVASKYGMEAAAKLMPRGMLAAASGKIGAALILKAIVTHPSVAELAYNGAHLATTKASVYAPVIGDMVHFLYRGRNAQPEGNNAGSGTNR